MSIDVSIVVPTCNRMEKLKNCLESIANQDFPNERVEIIVVDDRADKDVEKMLNYFKGRYQNLQYIAQDRKGPAAARNLGAKIARGKVVGFIDDDCVLEGSWLRAMADAHEKNPEIAAVGGDTITSTDRSPALVSQFLSTGSIEIEVNSHRDVIFFPTCNVAIKKSILDSYRFNEDFPLPGGEDLEFFWRLFKAGHRFIWDRSLKVTHYRDDTLPSFLKQAYYYGRGNLLVKYIHQDQPLLKELKTGHPSFWGATLINIIKIPLFSYVLGNRLVKENTIKSRRKKLSVYSFLILHKILYILGNIVEFVRIDNGLIKKKTGATKTPQLLILDITHSCNLHCLICDIWKTAKSETDIDISYIKKMLSEAKDLGIKEIALSGGEALARKDIFEIFDYAKALKIKNLGVLTNGILVKDNLDRIKPYLLDGSISLVVSLDSLKEGLHNQIRNSATAWQDTMEALKKISVIKKSYPQVNFNVISIILNQNLEELMALAKFIKGLGANSLQFQSYLPSNLEMTKRQSSPFWVEETRFAQLDEALDALISVKKEDPDFIKNSAGNLSLIKKYYRGKLTHNDVKCLSADRTILVSNQGECTTCFGPYGDIRIQSLKDVLGGKKIIHSRREVGRCLWPCLLPCFCDKV